MFEDIEDDDLMDEMLDDDNDDDAPPEESGNRNFVLIVGGLVVLVLIILICIVIFLAIQNGSTSGTAARMTQGAEATAAIIQQTQVADQSTELALAVEMTEQVQSFTATPTQTELPTDVPTATNTPVVAQPSETPETEPTEDPRTATVSALLTEAAQPTAGTLVPTSTGFPTELPDTGFADDVGVGGLITLAALSVLLIFLVRRLRLANR